MKTFLLIPLLFVFIWAQTEDIEPTSDARYLLNKITEFSIQRSIYFILILIINFSQKPQTVPDLYDYHDHHTKYCMELLQSFCFCW